ncbi:MAG: formylglycine-generating enzyme family protein [Bacteriovoracaceae bacterium]|nr:formylglycine-generating enzyme family protein [Bacteriovoracaceae bacterium]
MLKIYLLTFFIFLNPFVSLANLVEIRVLIPAGKSVPFFKGLKEEEIVVKSFYLDKFPVSNEGFNQFLIENGQYQKSQVSGIFVDNRYLEHWQADLLTDAEKKIFGLFPVVNTSWFVARKYCEWMGQRLPTIEEWEYAADVTNQEIMNQILLWYSKTGINHLEKIGSHTPNKFGLYDMHGLIWEWVEDFNSVMISGDSREKGNKQEGLFCGGGSLNVEDAKAYVTFMRYGFRSGLIGNYSIGSLGFRCAMNHEGKENKETP